MTTRTMKGALAAALLFAAAPLAGQAQAGQPPAQQDTSSVPMPRDGEVRLVYEREVYDYGAAATRDPFRPLIGPDGQMGPTFQNLTLRGIIYSTGRGQSVALLADRSGKIYRARRGDIVGNARILEIRPLEVLFAVEDFGVTRQEMLRLKERDSEGAQG